MPDVTTMKLPTTLRDRIKHNAKQRGQTMSEYVDSALRELEQAEFIRAAQAQRPDKQYLQQFAEWDSGAGPELAEWSGPLPFEDKND